MGPIAEGLGDWPLLALTLFAVWRVSHLLANEDGPGDLVLRLRVRLGDGWRGALLDCFQCVSLWVAAPFAMLLTRDPVEWLVAWLGCSGAACLLERLAAPHRPVDGLRSFEGDEDHGMLWTGTPDAPEAGRPPEP